MIVSLSFLTYSGVIVGFRRNVKTALPCDRTVVFRWSSLHAGEVGKPVELVLAFGTGSAFLGDLHAGYVLGVLRVAHGLSGLIGDLDDDLVFGDGLGSELVVNDDELRDRAFALLVGLDLSGHRRAFRACGKRYLDRDVLRHDGRGRSGSLVLLRACHLAEQPRL
jgi:hypothetical protein